MWRESVVGFKAKMVKVIFNGLKIFIMTLRHRKQIVNGEIK